MIQDVWNHEGKVEGVLFERNACGVGKEHFAEDSKHAAKEHADGNDECSFVHDRVW